MKFSVIVGKKKVGKELISWRFWVLKYDYVTSLLVTIKDRPYQELRLPSLEHRQVRDDMIKFYKYMTGRNKTSSQKFERHKATTKGNSMKLTKQQHKTTIRGNYLTIRTVYTWNSVPEAVVTAPNLNTFKTQLESFWKELQGVYKPDCYKIN